MLPMQERNGGVPGSKPDSQITTIDDVIQLAQELLTHLNQLGEYKHPLDVRRGRKEVGDIVDKSERSKTLKTSSKTYFFDIKDTREGKPYLVITESRFKGKGEDRERQNIIVFQENAQDFSEAVSEMVTKLD